MLVSAMISEIRAHGFDDLEDERLVSFINDKYYDFCSREPWPFLETSSNLTLTGGKVTAPTNIDKVIVIVDTTTGQKLHNRRLDEMTYIFPTELGKSGDALYYFHLGPDLYVYPRPSDGATSLLCRYVRVPAALTLTPDSSPIIPVQFHYILVLGALTRAYSMEDDPENYQLFIQQYEKSIQEARTNLWTREYDEPDTILNVFSEWD